MCGMRCTFSFDSAPAGFHFVETIEEDDDKKKLFGWQEKNGGAHCGGEGGGEGGQKDEANNGAGINE